MTATRPPAAGPPAAGPIPVSPTTAAGRRLPGLPAWVLAVTTAATTGVFLHLGAGGYLYGVADHGVLAIRGISWADPEAFVNDWFNERAPQPHWLFDLITFAGETMGALPTVYFAYWVASLLAFGWAAAWLAQRWLPERAQVLTPAIGMLAALGPNFVLGTFLPVLPQALPNGLGGCLGLLTVAALVTERHRAATVLAIATGLVHVQHGVLMAAVLAGVAVLGAVPRSVRVRHAAVAAGLLAMSLVVATARGLVADNDDFREICERASWGHCHANVWGVDVIRDGLLVLVLACAVVLLQRRDWRVLLPAVVGPAVVVAGGLVADRYDVAVLGPLTQRLFLYRFAMLAAPFAPWAVVLLAARRFRTPSQTAAAAAAVTALTTLWLAATWSAPDRLVANDAVVAGFGAAVGVAFGLMQVHRRPAVAAASAIVVAAAFTILTIDQRPFHLGFAPDEGIARIGGRIEGALPPGSVLAHPPDMSWIRFTSRRAVVGECRAVPYGGPPWEEFKERLDALGSGPYGACPARGYRRLTLDDVRELKRRFGATHALFLGDDPKRHAAAGRWPVVWTSGDDADWAIFEIPDTRP